MTGHPGRGGTQLGAPRPGRSWDPWERAWPHQEPCASGKERPGQKFPSQRLARNPWDSWLVRKALHGAAAVGAAPGSPLREDSRSSAPSARWRARRGRARLQTAAGAPPGLRIPRPLPAPPHTLCPSVPSCLLLPRTLTQRMLKDPTPSSRRASHLMVGEGTAV